MTQTKINIFIGALLALTCCFSMQLLAGPLQDKFRSLVNNMTPAAAKSLLNSHFTGMPYASYRNVNINKEAARIGLDNISQQVLSTKAPFKAALSFLFGFNNTSNASDEILTQAALAKICGGGSIFKYNPLIDYICNDKEPIVKLFDYETPDRRKIPVTVYSMFDTILKNADNMKSKPNPTADFMAIYNHLNKSLDGAKEKQ